jgi:energy-coupling factor transporter ATP-binding protein EcfA2
MFCETYFPRLFSLAWSADHLQVIAKIERTVRGGEMFAVAMPRGSGKTTLCQVAVLWAIVTGRHPFVMLAASTQDYAVAAIENLKSHLATNDLLLEDYPEIIHPIRALEGETRRCGGQRYYGSQTHIGWSADEIVIATIPGSRASGAVVRVAGITGNIRGAMFVRPDGTAIRPTLAICDDPQTDASARSVSQTRERLALVNGAIAGLAGPGKQTAIIMPCTVIRSGDLADQLLDRAKNPLWQGERMKMVYAFPTDEKTWEQYAQILNDDYRAGGDGSKATDFYRANQAAMDAGARVAWPARYSAGEISAIQNAMNLKLRDPAAFFAEYQNEPIPEKDASDGEETMTAEQIAAKLNGYQPSLVPVAVAHLTMFIDVHERLLYWIVCGWQEDFTGYIVDYGAYPDQRRQYFALRDSQRTLQSATEGAGMEGAIFAGLERLATERLATEWKREDGALLRVGLCLVDANWGQSTDLVYQFCRQSGCSAQLMPSHGKFIGAGSKGIAEWQRRPGDRTGLNWKIPNVRGARAIRHVLFDSNYWKSFVHARLAVHMGDAGSLSLYGRDHMAHALLADHLTAEYRVKTEGRGRTVDEWKSRPNKPDNHWLDGLVGCAVAASILGVAREGHGLRDSATGPRKYKVDATDMARMKGRR